VATDNLRELARSLTRREFIDRHPHLFLVLNAPEEGVQPSSSFATQAVSQSQVRAQDEELVALPIVKGRESPFQGHVSLGRARNCDLVVRHPSISKLHARFRTEGVLALVDAGSQNGTFVDGKRLLPNESAPVTAGSEVAFGSVAARLLDAAALYRLLQAPSAIAR
jgi:pSer/pThr/pTyr-binding forkhead associated (FHA) protein